MLLIHNDCSNWAYCSGVFDSWSNPNRFISNCSCFSNGIRSPCIGSFSPTFSTFYFYLKFLTRFALYPLLNVRRINHRTRRSLIFSQSNYIFGTIINTGLFVFLWNSDSIIKGYLQIHLLHHNLPFCPNPI
jgi:hypothetical protein